MITFQVGMSFFMLVLILILFRMGDELVTIKETYKTIEEHLRPLRTEMPEIPTDRDYNVESIPRLLSSIKVDRNTTLFDYITDHSNAKTESLNLMKAHNVIVDALSTLKLNEDVAVSTGNQRKSN